MNCTVVQIFKVYVVIQSHMEMTEYYYTSLESGNLSFNGLIDLVFTVDLGRSTNHIQ